MEAAAVREGAAVVVRAADDFYQFIDGWRGTAAGWEQGHVVVKVHHQGVDKVFLVPPEQLEEVGKWQLKKKKLVTWIASIVRKK